MRIVMSSTVNAPAHVVFNKLCESATMVYLSRGFMTYNTKNLPRKWQTGKKFNLRPKFKGLAMGDHIVEFKRIDSAQQLLYTEESGGFVTRWDHTMELKPLSNGCTRHTDTVIIEAGLLTPLVALFAKLLYRHRHKRWSILFP